jgi:hypothetical protein
MTGVGVGGVEARVAWQGVGLEREAEGRGASLTGRGLASSGGGRYLSKISEISYARDR